MSEQPGPCIFIGCVATWRHYHGGFPGGYDNPADPEGAPIEFEGEDPEPDAVRDYYGRALRRPEPPHIHNAPRASGTGLEAAVRPETPNDTPTRLSAAPDGAETATDDFR